MDVMVEAHPEPPEGGWLLHLLGYVDAAQPAHVRRITEDLRRGKWEGFENFAYRLREQGIDPDTAWVVECFGEDCGEYMVLVTVDGDVVEAIFDPNSRYRPDSTVTNRDRGSFVEWRLFNTEDAPTARKKVLGAIERLSKHLA